MHRSALDLLLLQIPNLEEPPYLVGAASLKAHLSSLGVNVKCGIVPSKIFVENPALLDAAQIKKTFSNQSEIIFDDKNLQYAIDEIREIYLQEKPKYLGFSVIFGNVTNTIYCAKKIKVEFPEVKILFGGPGVSLEGVKEELRSVGDFIFHGDSEHSVYEFLTNKKSPEEILGLDWKTLTGWKSHREKPYFESLRSIPQPDYSDFLQAPYAKKLFESIPLSLGRGCPFRCRFCSVRKYGLEYRHYNLESCVQFIEKHVAKGKNNFYVHDPIVNGNPGWIRDFCRELIRKNLQIYWGGNLRLAKYLNEADTMDLLIQSGFRSIITGLESGSENVLRHMRKFHDLNIIDEIFEKIRKAKSVHEIQLNLQLIVGYPTETEEDFQNTLRFVEKHKDIITNILSCSAFMVIPSENDEISDLMQDPSIDLHFATDSNWSSTYSSPEIRLDRMNRAEKLFQKLGIPHRMFYRDRLESIAPEERLEIRRPLRRLVQTSQQTAASPG